ncbi:hypothetical protein ASD15_02460 [Massilia sp. Root351]|jgi:uncharacterized protein|uniref:PP0621 family protein n=1 Tax=Massilia sp. Root351 TaxID=1736522 RepID=UPI00070FDB07|nr:PP0621 family protein [Massilia sp. Root351]KQV90938.1 hypothetical protein ASD15_02460 [Massilia sp. Root351]
MTRILFWLALIFLVVAAIRSKLRAAARAQQMRTDPQQAARMAAARAAAEAEALAQERARQAGSPQAQARARAVAEAETMLSCAHCGVFFPASEAVQRGGRDFCSQAHAEQPAP